MVEFFSTSNVLKRIKQGTEAEEGLVHLQIRTLDQGEKMCSSPVTVPPLCQVAKNRQFSISILIVDLTSVFFTGPPKKRIGTN